MVKIPRMRPLFLLAAAFLVVDLANGLIVQENQPCNKDRDILLAEDPSGNQQAFLRCAAAGVGTIGFWEKRYCPNEMVFDFVNQQCKTPIATQIVNLFNGASNALNPDPLPHFAILNSSCSKGEQCIGGTVCDLESFRCLCPVGTVTNLETLSCESSSFGRSVQSSNLPQAKIYPVPPQNGGMNNYFKGSSYNGYSNSNENQNSYVKTQNNRNGYGNQGGNGNYGGFNNNNQQQGQQNGNYGGFNGNGNNYGGSFVPTPVIDVFMPDQQRKPQNGVFMPEPTLIEPVNALVGIGAYCNQFAECDYDSTCINSRCACASPLVQHEGKCVLKLDPVQVGPGELCDNGEICTKGSICDPIIPVCVCPQGTDLNEGYCVAVRDSAQFTGLPTTPSRQTLPPSTLASSMRPEPQPQPLPHPHPQPQPRQPPQNSYNNLGSAPTPHTNVPAQPIRTAPPPSPSPSPSVRPSTKPNYMKIQLGGSKQAGVGVKCSLNTDCMIGAYCNGNTQPPTCQCLSTHVNVNGRCEKVIYPGQTGCEHDLQCTSSYAGTTCQNRQCVCPEGSKAVEQTCVSVDEKVRSPPGGSCSEAEECSGGSVCREGWCICPDPSMIVTRGLCVQTQPRPTLPPSTTPYRPQPGSSMLPAARKAAPGTSCGPLDQCVGGASCVDSICLCPAGTQPNQVTARCERLGTKSVTVAPENPDWLTEELFPSSRQTPLPPRTPTRMPIRQPLPEVPSSGDEYFAQKYGTNHNQQQVTRQSVTAPPAVPRPAMYSKSVLTEFGGRGQDENEIDEEFPSTPGSLTGSDECAQTGLICKGGTICINLTCQCPETYILHNDQCVPPITPKKILNKRKGKSSYRGPRYASPAESCANGEICTGGAVCQGQQTCVCPSEKPHMRRNICTAPEEEPQIKPKLAGPGQECNNDIQCTELSACHQGICRCQTGYITISGKCVKLPSTPVPTAQTTRLSVFVGPEEGCGQGKECGGGSSCQNGVCKCPVGLVAADGKCQRALSTRMPTSVVSLPARQSRLGSDSECTDDTQCGEHAICVVNRCKCRTGYSETDGACVPLGDVAFDRHYSQNTKPRIVGPPIRKPKPKKQTVQIIPSGRANGKGICPPGNDPLMGDDGRIRLCNGMNPTCPPKSYCYVTGIASEEYNCCRSG